ncbi:adenylyl-sulfate kinase [Sphingobacterium faecium]|uniref:adenylyl-sulfate kinase n=1 Tax=Sphingobacterium faecium TaxID=34087 RepID=UPI003208E7A6
MNQGLVIWLTGFSGAGKTTIALALREKILQYQIPVELLDGDLLRDTISSDLAFSRKDRETQGMRVGFIAGLLVKHGVFVIVSTISPYRNVRDQMRTNISNFLEVYVKCSLNECEKRDVKGLYRKARLGELENFTGVHDTYEEPLNPDVICHTETETVSHCVEKIISVLKTKI